MHNYTLVESFDIDYGRSICKYLSENIYLYSITGTSYKGKSTLVYSVQLAEEDALFITIAYPDVYLTKSISDLEIRL